MKQKKIRFSLLLGSILAVIVLLAFLWVLNINESAELRETLLQYIVILGSIAIVFLCLFFWNGPVFSIDGTIESSNIMAMLITLLIVIQFAFSFAAFSQESQGLKDELYESMQHGITEIENQEDLDNITDVLSDQVSEIVLAVNILDSDGKILYHSDISDGTGSTYKTESYKFPYYGDMQIQYIANSSYINSQLKEVLLNLLTTLVMSVFFSVEIVWLMIKVTTQKHADKTGDDMPMALSYVRQLAFLFYFASRLSSSFIPVMAKSFGETFMGMSENGAASVPQSAETLFTCVAIFLTTGMLTKKGWKVPFITGLAFVAAGTFISGISVNLFMFIAARAIVGLGYGFCWMTLRNLALLGRTDKEQAWGFAMLNAGLYAGMNCGSSVGAILAQSMGYRMVFIIATVMTVLCSIMIIRMENEVITREPELVTDNEAAHVTVKEVLEIAAFAVLMIAPSCIVASYLSYYIPLYYDAIGRRVTDVGRVQLLYGIIIVYLGPKLSEVILSKGKTLIKANFWYNIIFSVGLLVSGVFGGFVPSIITIIFISVADSFGFGVQNNYFLSISAVKKLGPSKSLSYLSFLKKISEMLGPMAFALMILLGYKTGLLVMGVTFIVALCVFAIMMLKYDKAA